MELIIYKHQTIKKMSSYSDEIASVSDYVKKFCKDNTDNIDTFEKDITDHLFKKYNLGDIFTRFKSDIFFESLNLYSDKCDILKIEGEYKIGDDDEYMDCLSELTYINVMFELLNKITKKEIKKQLLLKIPELSFDIKNYICNKYL